MASQRIPSVLAVEVPASGKASSAERHPSVDPPDGHREPDLGTEHIANELRLKLGIRVSPRTVGKYWLTFVRNHAQAMVACDFFVVVTARFRILYVFVLMELGRRRILHCNVTDHPSAEWTLQQLREALPDDHPLRFLIHDRDSILSMELDQAVAAMGVRVLRTPPQAPKANAVCERVVGTIRRECLDFLIPLGQRHLKHTLNRWILYYNHGRVHMSLGPGIPTPSIRTGFRRATECVAKPCWVDCTTSTGWKRSPHERGRIYCAPHPLLIGHRSAPGQERFRVGPHRMPQLPRSGLYDLAAWSTILSGVFGRILVPFREASCRR